MYTYHKHNKYFFFTDSIDDNIKNNAFKFKNLNIIFYNKKDIKEKNIDIIKYNKVHNFCKKNSIPIYITNNFKLLFKLKADGIFITSENTYSRYPRIKNKIFIGLVHNQREYYFKEKQNCNIIMLSPLFFNQKYSKNKILYPLKFNLITLNWKSEICALGGINAYNINKTKSLRKVNYIAFLSWLKK